MPSPSDINPVNSMNFSVGNLGQILLFFFLGIVIVGLIGISIWLYIRKKRLKYTIPLYKTVGSKPIKIATYKARDYKIGVSGDKLWYIPKAKKYISPATKQTANNEFPHFEREDGEWINFDLGDIDSDMKQAGVKYIHQDMRAQRIAIGNILENRFRNKQSWWEKYGHLVTHVIFYLVVCIALVVIFYQWSDIVDKTSQLFDKIVAYEEAQAKETKGIVPAFALFMFQFSKIKLRGFTGRIKKKISRK